MRRIRTLYCTLVLLLVLSGVSLVPVSAQTFDPSLSGSKPGSDTAFLNEFGMTIKKLPDAPQAQTTISSSTGKNANPVVNEAIGKMQAAGMEVTSTQTARYEISITDEAQERIRSESAVTAAGIDKGLTDRLTTDYAGQVEQFEQLASSTKDNSRHENGQTISQVDVTSVTFTDQKTRETRNAVIIQNVDSAGNPEGAVQVMSDPVSYTSSPMAVKDSADQKELFDKYNSSCYWLKVAFWFVSVFLVVVILVAVIIVCVSGAMLCVGGWILPTSTAAVTDVLFSYGAWSFWVCLSATINKLIIFSVIGSGAFAVSVSGLPALFNSMKDACTQKESYGNDIAEPMRAHGNLLDNHRAIAWQNYAGPATSSTSIQSLPDGGYVTTGFKRNEERMVGVVTTFDAGGRMGKTVSIGNDMATTFNNVQVSPEGSLYLFGTTTSSPGPGIVNRSGKYANALVIKMDKDSNIVWSRTFGGAGSSDAFISGTLANDGTIYAAGSRTTGSNSVGLIAAFNPDGSDSPIPAWGNESFRTIKYSADAPQNQFNSIGLTREGGLIIAGSTQPDAKSEAKGFLLSLHTDGNEAWRSVQGADITGFKGVTETRNGGYITVGTSTASRWDGYVFSGDQEKLGSKGILYTWDANGKMTGQKEFANLMETSLNSIHPASDGGYIVSGVGRINGGPVAGVHGGLDAWVAKLRPDLSIEWQKSIGGSRDDQVYDAIEARNGDVIATGYTKSIDYDLTDRGNTLNDKRKMDGYPTGWVFNLRYDATKTPDAMDIRL